MRNFYLPALLNKASGPCRSFLLIFTLLFFAQSTVLTAQTVDVTGVLPSPVCAGANVTVTFDVTNGTGAYYSNSTNYTLYLSNASGSTFAAQGATFTVSSGSYNTTDGATIAGLTKIFTIPAATAGGAGYKISIGSSAPSFDASSGTGASGAFTVNQLYSPDVTITSDDGDNAICAGDNITFTATPTDAGANPLYQWRVNGVNVGGNTTNNTYSTTALTNNQIVSVRLTTAEACYTTQTAVSNSIQVTVNPLPTVNIGTAMAAICQGGTSASLGGGVGGGATGGTWTSSAGGSFSPNANTLNATWTPPPAYSGTATLTLSTTGGFCGTVNDSKTILVNPAPTVVTNTPAAVCSPNTVNLTAAAITSGSTSGLTFTYWTNAAATTSYTTPSTAGAGTYYIKGTTAAGCFDIQPVTVTVNPSPTVVTNAPAAVCSPNTVNLTAAAITSGSTSGLTFTYWTNAAATASYATPSTAGAGTYYIKGTTADGCFDVQPVTVAVNPTPTVVINTPAAVCSPNTVNLTTAAITSGSTGSLTFTYWTNAAATTAYATPSTAGAGTYYIKGATAAGCFDIQPVTVTGNPTPTVVINTPAAVCSPNTVNLTAAGVTSGSTSGLTFTYWTNAAATTSYATPSTAGAGTYYIKGTTADGCFDIKSVTVTVNATVATSVSIGASSSAICSGTNVTFTATPTNGGSSPTYQWKKGATNVGTSSSTYTTNSLANNDQITVVMTSNATCPSPVSSTSNAIQMAVYTGVPATPGTITTNAPGSICPVATGYTFSVPAVANATSYQWNLPDAGWIITAGAGTNSITVTVSGTAAIGTNKDVTVQAVNPCGVSPQSINVRFRIDKFAAVDAGSDLSLCFANSISLSGTLLGAASQGTWTFSPAGAGSLSNVNTSSATATFTPAAGFTSGNVTFTLTPNTPGGSCSGGISNDQMILTVNSPSAAPTSLIAGTPTICNGGSSMLTQTGGTLGTGASWKWYTNNTYTTLAGTGSGANASLSVNPTTNTTYYLRAESTTGAPCAANVAGPAAGVTVTVNQPSVAPTVLNVSTATICSGNNTTLTQTGGTLGTGGTWKWYSDNSYNTLVGTGTGANASLSVSPTTNTTYYLRAESTTGAPCASDVAGPAAGVTVTVNQPSVAASTLSASLTSICNGSSVDLSQLGGSLGTGATWKWYTNSSYTTLAGTGTGANAALSVSPTATTTYYLLAESTTGAPCAANVPGPSAGVTVTVNQPSVAPTGLAASTPTICSGNNTTLTQTGGSLGTGATWKWYSDNNYTTLVAAGSGANASLSVSPATTTTYYLRAEITGSSPCAVTVDGPSAGVTVTVNQPSVAPTNLSTSDPSICNGSAVTLSQTGGSLGTGATWKWYTSNSFSAGSYVGDGAAGDGSITLSPTSTTTYYLRAESTTGNPCAANVAASGSVKVNVHNPIRIISDPDDATVCASFPVSFTVQATGSGATYEWFKDGSPLSNGGTITGATSATLTISQAAVSDMGIYTVTVTGTAPCGVATSAGANLTVNQSITISQQPTPLTICTGTQAIFTVDATGSISDYQWRRNGVPVSDGSGISGSLTNTLTIDGAVSGNAGDYDVVISGTDGTCSQVISTKAKLIVDPVSVGGTAASDQTICSGTAPVNITLSGQTGNVVKWQKSSTSDFSSGVTDISNITTTLNNIGTLTGVTYFRAVVQSGVCTPANSTVVTISIDPVSVGGTAAGDQTICNGTMPADLTLSGQTGNVVKWQKSTSATFASAITDIASTSTTLTGTAIGNLTTTTYFRAVVQSGSCPSANSSTVTVTVDPATVGGTIAGGATVCSGTNSTVLTLSGHTGSIVRWESSTDNFATSPTTIANTTTQLTASNLTATTQYRAVVKSGTCGEVNSAVAIVTVDPVSVGGTVSADQTICNGTKPTDLTLSGQTGNVVKWQKSVSATFASGITDIAGTSATLTGATIGNLTATTYFRAVVQSGVCTPANSSIVAVTVDPVSVGGTIAGGATVCSGTNSTALTLSGHTGSIVRWESSTDNFATSPTTIANTTTQLTASNLTATTQYRAVVKSGTCGEVTSAVAIVAVDPVSVGGSVSASQSICAGTQPANLALSSYTGSIVKWQKSTSSDFSTGVADIISTSATLTGATIGNPSATTYFRAIVQSGVCSAVPSASVTIAVSLLPAGGTLAIAGATPSNVKTLCPPVNGYTSNETFNLTGSSGSVAWQMSTNGGSSWVTAAGTAGTNSFTVANVAQTTIYRAVVTSGNCSPAYSSIVVLQVIPSITPTNPKATPPVICLGQSSVLSADIGYPTIGINPSDGNFNNGASDNKTWTVRNGNTIDGNALNAGGDNGNPTYWRESTGKKYLDYNSPDGKYAITHGVFNTSLESPIFSLLGQTTATIQFIQSYHLEAGDSAVIEFSTDGGATYGVAPNLAKYVGPADLGPHDGFASTTLDLSNYIGLSNLRFRFHFYSKTLTSTWALDNLSTPNASLPASYTWVDGTRLDRTDTTVVTATPITPGLKTYTLTTMVGGCPGGSVDIQLTVNPLPTITLGTIPDICQGVTTIGIPYTATTDNPTKFTVIFDAAAQAAGFRDTTDVNLPSPGPISLTVPAGIGAGTYKGTISVSNANNCGSKDTTFTITVKPAPTAKLADGIFCQVGTTTISVTDEVGGPASNKVFSATPAGLNIDAGTGVIDLAASTAGTYTVTYNFTGANGCATYPVPTTTITVNPQAVITAQPTNIYACPEGAVAFTVGVSSTPAPAYAWQVSADNGATWNPATGADYSGANTATLTVDNVTAGNTKHSYLFKANLDPASTCPVITDPGKLIVRNIWFGYQDANWNNKNNWSDTLVPSQMSCDSVIILNVTNKPILSGGAAGAVNHLKMRTGAELTITGNTMQIAGSITNDNMSINATAGKLDLNGDKELYQPAQARLMQTIAGKMFATPYNNNSGRIKDLQMSSPNNASVAGRSALNDTLNITGVLSFGDVNGKTLNTSNNITLVSNAVGTAQVADITNNSTNTGNTYTGTVIAERFINIGTGAGQHPKTWVFLGINTDGQSVFNSWMEGGAPTQGYGTIVTDPRGTSAGFDPISSLYPSMKVYKQGGSFDPFIGEYEGIPNTAMQILNPSKSGYMVFIRGDRTVTTSSAPAKPTTVRTQGSLLLNDQTVPFSAYDFTSIGNPYASALDMKKLMNNTPANGDFYYLWKPVERGLYGYGSFITYGVDGNGNYIGVPSSGQINTPVQSGQAFILQTLKKPGNMVFKETYKAAGSSNEFFTPVSINSLASSIRTDLYAISTNGTPLLADGTLNQFGEDYNSGVDGGDARKFLNGTYNFYVKVGDSKPLVIEKRKNITHQDTIFFGISNMVQQSYELRFKNNGLSGMAKTAFLEDLYLKTSTALDLEGETVVKFAITGDKGSYATDRFRIVFEPIPAQQFTFLNLKGYRIKQHVQIQWKVANENKLKKYGLERSTDGKTFTHLKVVNPLNRGIATYDWLDANPFPGRNFYRIRSEDEQGTVSYSSPVIVEILEKAPSIAIFPNPIVDGVINLNMVNQPAGNYGLRILNNVGQVIYAKQITRMDGDSIEKINWDFNMAHGLYKLEVTKPDGSLKIINVMY